MNETNDNYNMEDFQVDDSWEQSCETKTDTSVNNESAEYDEYEVDGDLYRSKEFIPEPTREVSYSSCTKINTHFSHSLP